MPFFDPEKLKQAAREAERRLGLATDPEQPTNGHNHNATDADEPPPPNEPPEGPDEKPPPRRHFFRRGDHVELGEATLTAVETNVMTYDEGSFWRYEDSGVWHELSEALVQRTAASFAGCPVATDKEGKDKSLKITAPMWRGASDFCRLELLTRPDHATFAAPTSGIAFTNGFAVVDDGKLTIKPHSPRHMARHCYPFPLIMGAPHPKLDEFLDTLFGDCNEEEKATRICLLQEFLGACLIGKATVYQVALILYGPGDNGKSELLRLATAIFPPGSLASLPPQEWGERFQIAALVGKLANFVDEIPEREITKGELFKSVITAQVPIHAERKHQTPFEYRPIAGHIFSANALPGTVDHTPGFWRRFVVIPLTRNLRNLTSHRPEAALHVIENELAAVIAWAIEGILRLQKRGRYIVPEGAKQAHREWQEEADAVRRWFRNETVDVLSVQDGTLSSKLYESYKAWAHSNGYATMSSGKFGRRARSIGKRCHHTRNGEVMFCRVLTEMEKLAAGKREDDIP